jgi:hypothetical protein
MTLNAELSTSRAALGEGCRDAVAAMADYRIPIFERLLWTLVESGGIAETQRRSGDATAAGSRWHETGGARSWPWTEIPACGHDNGRQGRPLR